MKLSKRFLAAAVILAVFMTLLCACVYDEPKTDEPSNEEETETETNEEEFNYSQGLTSGGKWEGIDACYFVKLPQLTGVEIPKEAHTVSDEKLQSQIDLYTSSLEQTKKVTDRNVADGDSVNIDYVGKIDGVAFENGSTDGAGTTVTIGVTNYIDDFLEQLIGHKPGETFDVNVTFPDPYENNPDLAGKPAVFTTTINYIEEKVMPELTDELISENFSETYGWETLTEMRDGLYEQLQNSAILTYIQQYLLDESKFTETLPESMIDIQEKTLINAYKIQATMYGMELDTLLTNIGISSKEELIDQSRGQIEDSVKFCLCTQAIAETLRFTATDDNIRAYFLKNTNSEDYSQFVSTYGEPYVKMIVLQDLALNYIKDNAIKL